MLEKISNRGNGNYAFIDTAAEARKVLVEQMTGTLITIAKDVKIQVEFNPALVASYRLIGYENRVLAAQDFNDHKKDAGEIGAGHSVTAFYEIVPVGKTGLGGDVDELKYQRVQPNVEAEPDFADELLTLKIRYKEPHGETSLLLKFPLNDSDRVFADADPDFQFAAAVAAFGMLLRGSAWKGNATLDAVLEIAESAAQEDSSGYHQEFLSIVRRAKELSAK
jgi:Ca-activated chloride channel homolog